MLTKLYEMKMILSLSATFVQTMSTGMPRLCVRTLSPRGSSTLSSSPPAAGARLWGEAGVDSSGSTYSWKALTTAEKRTRHKQSQTYSNLTFTVNGVSCYIIQLTTLTEASNHYTLLFTLNKPYVMSYLFKNKWDVWK